MTIGLGLAGASVSGASAQDSTFNAQGNLASVSEASVSTRIGPRILTMENVVTLAQENSVSGMMYRNSYVASYWSYRSFKAEYLPSLSLSTNLGNFNRSLVSLQDYNTGAISYRPNYTLSNDATLSLSQNIALTGGTLSLSSSLSRLDQYNPDRLTTYYTQPLYLSYMQSLWGYNSLKWNKEIEPKNYEIAKREYLENMEQVNASAVSYFWSYAAEKDSYEQAAKNFEESKRLYAAAQKRFDMGTMTRDNLMQLELKVLQDSLSIINAEVSLRSALNKLCSFIGYQEDTKLELIIGYDIPEVTLVYDEVLERALENSSFQLSQTVQAIQADASVAQAKANRGLNASLQARFGLSNDAAYLKDAFVEMQDQEVVGISLSIPIVDWGLGEGRVKMAKAQAETTRASLQQSMTDYRQNLFTQVMQFNSQRSQCEIARRAAQIADESYELALRNFGSGTMSVTDLNQLQTTRDNARSSYVSSVAQFWNSYFGIRKTTLYDYITGTDISAEFDKLVK